MEVYVKTAGKRIDLEYNWYRITRDKLLIEVPPMLLEWRVESLIQDQSFSVVLTRSRGQLMLLVGWMESGRLDFADRHIRNFVAWVGDSGDELSLRALAAHALRGRLETPVSEAITQDKNNGFEVALDKLEALAASPELAARAGHAAPDPQPMWGANTVALRLELADQLERDRLPGHEGPLVIVTGITSSQKLVETDVWRALASTIQTNHFTPIQKKKSRARSKAFSTRYLIPLLVFLLILLIAIVVTRLIKG